MKYLYWPACQILLRWPPSVQLRLATLALFTSLMLVSLQALQQIPNSLQGSVLITLALIVYLLACLVWIHVSIHTDFTRVLNAISQQQHGARMVVDGHRSFRSIALLFNTLGRRYQRLNRFAGASAEETQFTASELQTTSSQLASFADEQHQRLQSTAASAEQISATIAEIAAHIEQTQQLAITAQQNSHDGQQCASSAVEEIARVVDEVNLTEGRLRHLKESSQQITEVTSTIEGISQQINLLALNASIEAARAGQAGRGFAVVADEIRHLAQRTKEATGSIGGLLDSVSEQSEHAFAGIVDSQQRVSRSAEQVNQTRQALVKIHQGAVQTHQSVDTVNRNIQEHLQVSQQMAQSLEAISQLAEKTRSSTEKTEDMVHYLNALSHKLSNAIDDSDPNRSATAVDPSTDSSRQLASR